MASIYQLGVQSIVWLGAERDKSSEALRLIEGSIRDDPLSNHLSAKQGISRSFRWGLHRLEPIRKPLTDTDWQSIISLFTTREIWMRIWIIQEIVFTPLPLLLCGNQ